MSSDELAEFFVHTVSVETYGGTKLDGTVLYASAVTVPGFLSRKQRFVRNADNEQVPSGSSYSAASSWIATLAPKSRVTVPGEQPTTIIRRDVSVGTDSIDGIDRVKVYLQ